jgi:hypothetical protein
MAPPPDFFLILKAPPFPSTYDRELYIRRVINELAPGYSDVPYEFLVRALPESPEQLRDLMNRYRAGADFDKTILSPFDDTHGGKGLLVWVYGGSAAGAGGTTARCFLATAVYGQASLELVVLREFRDRRLLAHALGRAFVSAYERLSPGLARWLVEHRRMRVVVRFLVVRPAFRAARFLLTRQA